jgi:hypothetical protein
MGIQNEYRIARSASTDKTFNTLDLKRRPSFATMEFLDPGDSQYFATTLRGKGWRDVTPEPHKSRKTLDHVAPQAGELEAFKDITPDWLYLSGHYGRSYYAAPDKTLTVLPAGFFNEPFHKAEWESAWSAQSVAGVYLQAEPLDEAEGRQFHTYIATQDLVHQKESFHSLDQRAAADRVDEWKAVWLHPTDDLQVSAAPVRGSRGLFFTHVWDDVKVLLLVCCNALVWGKKGFRKAFPNALVLGWVGKNPANATPIIKQFLTNALRDVEDPSDPILMSHPHLIEAWTDVHYKQRLFQSEAMGYMKQDGEVFGMGGSSGSDVFIGNSDEITHPMWPRPKPLVFAFGVNNHAEQVEP